MRKTSKMYLVFMNMSNYQKSTLGGSMRKQFLLQSSFFDVLPRYANIMTDKGFKLFDDCAARCVHLSPEEEECTSSSWGDSNRYTSDSIAYLQRMLTEINKSSAIAKIRTWVESSTVKHLKTVGINSSKMQISLLILSSWYFGCLHIQRIFYFNISLKYFFKNLCVQGIHFSCFEK